MFEVKSLSRPVTEGLALVASHPNDLLAIVASKGIMEAIVVTPVHGEELKRVADQPGLPAERMRFFWRFV